MSMINRETNIHSHCRHIGGDENECMCAFDGAMHVLTHAMMSKTSSTSSHAWSQYLWATAASADLLSLANGGQCSICDDFENFGFLSNN